MLAGLKGGVSEGGGERLSRGYAYNSFGEITAVAERTTSNSFTYDGLGRLTSACGRTYSDDSVRQLQAGLSDDFELYNHGRPHQSADYLTPVGEHCVLLSEPAASRRMPLVFPLSWSSDWGQPKSATNAALRREVDRLSMQFIKNGPDVPERLLQAHEDGKVVFFCGAGISYPAGLPGFKGLVEEIYCKLGRNLSLAKRMPSRDSSSIQ